MKITAKLLSQIGACQIEKFLETFPSGEVKNTKKNIRRAFAAGMDVNWLAEKILCAPAWAKFEEVCDPAWAKYKEVRASAWAKYKEVRNASLVEFLSDDDNIKKEFCAD